MEYRIYDVEAKNIFLFATYTQDCSHSRLN